MTKEQKALYFTYWPGLRARYSDICKSNTQSGSIYYPGKTKITSTVNGGLI